MSLRIKLLAIMVLVAFFCGVAELSIEHWVIMPSFLAMEQDEAGKDLARCLSMLQREVDLVDRCCRNWAASDATYAYVDAPGEAYESANLAPRKYIENGLNVICILDKTGRVLWNTAYDTNSNKPIDMEEFPGGQWDLAHPLLQYKSVSSTRAGVFLTGAGPMLVASRPIVKTDGKGPIRGTMIVGRLLDNAFTQSFKAFNLVDVRLRPIREGDVSAEDARVLEQLAPEFPYYFEVINDDVLRVSTTFPGILSRTALIVQVDVPRNISARGAAALLLMRWMAILAGFTVLFIVTTTSRLMVVRPLTQLTRHVTSIGRGNDLSSILLPPHADEIGALTHEFNQMIRRIQEHNAERERAENALRESEEQLRIVVETAPAGIMTLDDEGIIRTFNPAAERLFGYAADEASGRPLRDLIPGLYETGPSSQPPAVPLSDQETIARRKDGRTVAVHWTVSETRRGDHRIFTGIVRDISELREMHERVLRTEHLATIGEMASILAHEIRNPLAGISGVVQMLRRELPLSDQRRELMDAVVDQVFRLDAVINQLSALAKLPIPVKRPADLRAVVEKVCREAEAREPWKQARFSFDGKDEVPAPIDVSLFEQVLWKLLGNAADALEARRAGAETPPPAEIRCRFQDTADRARVIISDNGAGMDYDVQEKLFRPFFSTKPGGTGLGLVFCRRVMESHEGTIAISSRPGEGTEVTLDFPKGC